MRVEIQQTKDTIAIIAFSVFPVFIIIFPDKIVWTLLVSFLFAGAMIDACVSIFLCASKQIYASTIKDALGAIGLFAFTALTSIVGPTLVVRTVICCFFAVAFVIDAFCLVMAAGGCYNIYMHDLGAYRRLETREQDYAEKIEDSL